MKKAVYILFALLLTASCTGNRTRGNVQTGDTLPMKYAENICIVKHRGYTLAELKDPWKPNRTLHRYILLDGSDTANIGPLPQGTIIRRPVQRAVVFTTAHAALMQMLGAEGQIAGVCDLKYMLLPQIKAKVEEGIIADCADAMNADVEKMIEIKADAVLISPLENGGGYGQIEKTKIPIIECADYMETSPLGRAEWMKFYGLLFGCEKKADSLFAVVEKNYLRLKAVAAKSKTKPKVIAERKTGSTWYVPAGKSTAGIMFRDAAANYPFAENAQSGSLALPFESVLAKAGDADIWFVKYYAPHPMTYAELLAEYHGYAAFKAFKNKRVLGCNTFRVPFFEETPFRPDLLLRDYILILHPEQNVSGKCRYFTPIDDNITTR